jgi:hypothetical protein
VGAELIHVEGWMGRQIDMALFRTYANTPTMVKGAKTHNI